MSKINFPKKQEQRLIPKYLLEYAEELQENHPDPSEDWGGVDNIEAGTGIAITGDETKTISVDEETVAMVSNLSTVAFSGSYSDLSNKPDLSVYELKTDAFSGDYADLTNKPDLSVYELKSEAFSGDYNDLTNKPTIPTVNDSTITFTQGGVTKGTITLNQSSDQTIALDGSSTPSNMVTTNTTQTITGDKTFTGSFYVNSSNIITLEARPGIIFKSDGRPIWDNGTYTTPLVTVSDLPTVGNGTITIKKNNTTVDTFTTNQTSNKSINITVPTATSDLNNDSGFITSSDLSGYATETWVGNQGYITGITSSDVTTALGYTPGTSNFSGDYDDLTNKPTIPTVNDPTITFTQGGITKGTITLNQASNQTIALDAGSTPTNMVTTNTAQTITGQKTFTGNVYITGDKLLKLKSGNDARGIFTGFTAYDTSNREYGNLQIGKRFVNLGSGSNDRLIVSLGNYSEYYTGTNKPLVGFRAQDQSNTSRNFVMPTTNFATNFTGADTFYMPMMVNGVKANSDGNISITVPTPTVLYDVPNGENGVNPITMSDSFANYDYVDIQYRNYDNANQVKSVRIYNPNGKEVYVDWSVLNNGYIYAKKSIYVLNGNTMTVKTGSDMQAYYSNGSNMGVQVTATEQYQLQIKITKVVGWTDSRLS